MHELSIAVSIVELAQEEAERLGGRVTAVHLRLGALCGVMKEALETSYEVACADTPLQGSRLVIEELPVFVYCPRCEDERPIDSVQSFRCPKCGTATPDVRQGKEVQLVAMEIEE